MLARRLILLNVSLNHLQTNKTLTLAEIVAQLQANFATTATLAGPNAASVVVSGVATLQDAQAGHITFLANRKYKKQIDSCAAAAIIVSIADQDITDKPRILTANPYAYFARIVGLFHPPILPDEGVHPTAIVHPSTKVGVNVSIGPGVVIEKDVCIEDGAVIGAHCVVGAYSHIGKHTYLHARVTLYSQCTVGENTVIHSGAVIGADGFGFAPDFSGTNASSSWVKIPQIGGVVIGAYCDIGANTTIDRGALSDTVIGRGCILDNQIQIGHNCVVGDFTAIAGCVGIAGSTIIGKRCLIGGAAMLTGHFQVADGVTILAGTFVSKDINQSGVYGSSIPADDQTHWLKQVAQLRQLDSLAQRVKILETQFKNSH